MAKKIQLQDANGNVLHPLTLGECVAMDNGENLDTLMSKSQMFTPTITQDKSMFKVGTGVDVDYSANVKDGAYESLVFKGKSLVNLIPAKTVFEKQAIGGTSGWRNSYLPLTQELKTNTIYTLFYKLETETKVQISIGGKNSDAFLLKSEPIREVGTHYVQTLLTTKPETSNSMSHLYMQFPDNFDVGTVKATNMVLLEGNYMDFNVPYFEGLGSCKMPILRNVSSEAFCHDSLEGGTISGDGGGNVSSTNSRVRTKDMKKLNGATSILFSDNLLGVEKYVFSYDSNKRYLGRTPTNWETGNEIKPVEGAYYYRVVFTKYLEELPRSMYIIPKNHKTNILRTSEEIVLREVGGVQDTYNPLTGEYVRRIGEVVINGDDSINYNFESNSNDVTSLIHVSIPNTNRYFGFINDQMIEKIVYASNITEEGIFDDWNGVFIRILNSKLDSPNLEGVKAYLRSNPITVQYELAEPITTIVKPSTTTPFAYQNGHVILESGFEGQSLLPEIEYSVVTGRTGQVTQNTKVLRKQEQQIIGLEELLLTQAVQMEYGRTLLQFDYELQMMMLG